MRCCENFWRIGAVVSALSITACGGGSQGPTFHPIEGLTGKLAYITNVERTGFIEYQLRLLDLETGATRTIYTSPAGEHISAVAWHPDGTSLVITTASFSTGPSNSVLHLLNEDGSILAGAPNGIGPEFGASYSPQGALAYCGGFTPDAGLFINGLSVWPSDCRPDSPAWFPDGSALAMGAYVGGILGLYRVDISSRSATLIVAAPSPGGNVASSDVSPNGDVIAVPVADAEGWEIWLIQLDGSGSAVLPGSIEAFDPQWSPDASRIVFVQSLRPYVHELATGTVTRIIYTQVVSLAWYP